MALLLVDGTAVAYRAFYAIRNLSTRDGRPTNAVYGFVKMLNQLQKTWKPTHWAVVFDGGLPEERMAELETYKAQREPMPDDLETQLGKIDEFLALADIPMLLVEGQEADDVIATLARGAEREGAEVLIATNDKDLFQLVGDSVAMIPPTKVGDRMGPAEVEAKTGVRPDRIVEWLALTGDHVDNIPGVPGVGPKTAAKLLNQFGSVDYLLGHLGEVSSEKLRAALADHAEDIRRNVKLVRLRDDLDLETDWSRLRVRQPVPSKLIPFYDELEFRSLAEEMRELDRKGPMLDFGPI